MKSGLQISEGNLGPVRILRLQGYLDGHTFVDLERRLDALFKDGGGRVVVELSGLSYIASAGVGVFINGQHKARAGNGSLQLSTPSPSVREIFAILGLESVFVIHDSVEAAIEAAKA
ncbi:MAG: STAS domain-containing protein [Planctomycetes bacterium]|nr:STAS domain-containing protein [Planctomycetota bacterium]